MGILLAKQGITVQLLDAGTKLDENPRASHYSPSAIRELRRAGVLEDVQKEGFIPDAVCWREIDGKFITGIKSDMSNPDAMVCLPLDRLGRIMYRHLQLQPTADVKWSHRVVGIDQDEKEARVKVEGPGGPQTFSADYVIGCDGANSQVRRSLFGDSAFPGETLQSQIIATNVSLSECAFTILSFTLQIRRTLIGEFHIGLLRFP